MATVDAGGNTPPTMAISRRLALTGHEVHVLGHPPQRPRYDDFADFHGWVRARPWDPRPQDPGLRSMLAWLRLASDPGPGRDLVSLARTLAPDVLVVDCMIPAALRPARSLGAPVVMLAHAPSAYWFEQWTGPRPLNLWLHAARVHPADERSVPDYVVLTTAPRFDRPDRLRTLLASDLVQTGPVLPESIEAAPASPAADAPVLVSLSTLAYPGQAQCLQRVLDALQRLGRPAVVTLGPALASARLRVPPGVTLLDYVEHREVMPRCSAVVSHGGHGTTMTALAHGLPVLVLPMSPHADQHHVARAVQATGAGLALPREAPVARLCDAVEQLVADPAMRRNAHLVGQELRTGSGAARAAAAIGRAATRPPSRPPGHGRPTAA